MPRSSLPQSPTPLTVFPGQALPVWTVPAPPTPTVGRDTDISTAARMLDAATTRLVTLIGPGGIGKTRLAVEIARRVEGDYAHGACFVGLAPVRDAELVPAAVARALGLQESGDIPAAELVTLTLRDRHLLLVLDNLEHVVDGAASWVGSLLDACPRVTALATSRIALHIAGERRYLVEPLDLPGEGIDGDLECLSERASVALFVQHACGIRPDFTLTPANARAVAEVCRALDGVPLAIELAAARLQVLSPEALLARLTDRLDFLRSDMRNAPPRHQTMRDAVAWSHDLLSADEQWWFRRLAVFNGGFALDAAEALEESDIGAPAIDVLTSLVDQSLIHPRLADTDKPRFRMLEVIREYGLDRLGTYGETEAARDAQAAWCLDLAREADTGIEGSEQLAWLGRLDAELDNIRSALAWLRERERIADAQDLAGWMWIFLLIRGLYSEARVAYEALLAHPLGAAPTMGRAGTLNGLGIVAIRQGDAPRAMEALNEAVDIYRQLDARRQLVRALVCRASALWLMGRFDESIVDSTEGLAVSTDAGDRWGEAQARTHLGIVFSQRGDLDAAWAQMQAGVDLCRAMGESWVRSVNLGNLATIALRRGETAVAADYLKEGNRLASLVGDRLNFAASLAMQADLDRARGDTGSAEQHLGESLAVAIEMGDPFHIGYALVSLGSLATSAGEIDRAVPLLREAMSHMVQLGHPGEVGLCLGAFADVARAMGESQLAARWIGATDAALQAADIARTELAPDEHEARIATITAVLGEDGYQRSWEDGQALSLDEVIAEALAWEPPLNAAAGPPSPPAVSGPNGKLSPRELEVLKLMADGLTNQEVADALCISCRTATSHASTILGKLGVGTRTAAVAFAIRNGLS